MGALMAWIWTFIAGFAAMYVYRPDPVETLCRVAEFAISKFSPREPGSHEYKVQLAKIELDRYLDQEDLSTREFLSRLADIHEGDTSVYSTESPSVCSERDSLSSWLDTYHSM